MATSIHQILREVRAGLAEGAAAHDAERVREIGEQVIAEIEDRLSTARAALPTTKGEPPIYVVVCQNDKAHPRFGVDPDGPIVHEQYTRTATLENAHKRAAVSERWGAGRIARLVFEDVDGSPL